MHPGSRSASESVQTTSSWGGPAAQIVARCTERGVWREKEDEYRESAPRIEVSGEGKKPLLESIAPFFDVMSEKMRARSQNAPDIAFFFKL